MFIGIANSIGQRFGGAGIDPNAQAFLSAAGITGATETAAVNTLVTSLKDYGIWSKMKALYPFVTDNRNLLSYTEDFGNGYWTKTNNTITANSTTAPNGTNTADTFTDNTTNGQHKVQTSDITSVVGSGNSFVASAYFKANTATRAAIYAYGTSKGVGVDLTNGTQITINGLTNASAADVTITNVGNGWYRVTMKGVASGVFSIALMMISGNDFSYAGAGNSLYTWGAQLELGSSATTYQPIATTQQSYISSQFKYNLKDPRDLDAAFRLVFNGGWTHSSTGATPNGTNGYADTKLNPSLVLTNNNLHLAYYSRTNVSEPRQDLNASNNAPATSEIFTTMYNNTLYFTANIFSPNTASASLTNTLGFVIGNTTANNLRNIWKNGVKLATDTSTNSTALPNVNVNISARANPIQEFSTKQQAFASIGDGLSDTEASNLYTAVQAFQTSLSRQV